MLYFQDCEGTTAGFWLKLGMDIVQAISHPILNWLSWNIFSLKGESPSCFQMQCTARTETQHHYGNGLEMSMKYGSYVSASWDWRFLDLLLFSYISVLYSLLLVSWLVSCLHTFSWWCLCNNFGYLYFILIITIPFVGILKWELWAQLHTVSLHRTVHSQYNFPQKFFLLFSLLFYSSSISSLHLIYVHYLFASRAHWGQMRIWFLLFATFISTPLSTISLWDTLRMWWIVYLIFRFL